MMKTAVEFLVDKMVNVYGIDISDMGNAIHLAKAMEKEQIIEAYLDGDCVRDKAAKQLAEYHYNVNYGKDV